MCSALSHTLVQTVAKGVFEVIVDQSAFVPEESVEEQKTKEDGNGLPANELACQRVVGGKKTGERLPLILFLSAGLVGTWIVLIGVYSFVCVYTHTLVDILSCGGQMSVLEVIPPPSSTPYFEMRFLIGLPKPAGPSGFGF